MLSFNPFGGMTVIGLKPENRAEFFECVDPNMRRMPKEAVLPQLPPKLQILMQVDMLPKQDKAYRQMESDLVSMLDEGVLVAVNPLVQLTRLSQFASAHAVINEAGELKLDEPSCKIDALEEVMEDMNGEPLVVFAQSRQLIELAGRRLEKHGKKLGYITGGQTPAERQQFIEQFQAGQLDAILCTISAGGVGITLTRAHTAVFLQRSWSMVDNTQAEDRIHRIGSEIHDSVRIIDIVARGTVEERQREVLNEKSERLEEIVRDRDFMRRLIKGEEE
jgi:SNF2 family DNA or RNA helicase